nr:hypothetical protein [Mycoplasmopsis bovis]
MKKIAKLNIWFKSQNELFNIIKSVDVASTLLNQCLITNWNYE